MDNNGKLFEAYRALGLYSTHIPHCVRYHHKHKEHYVFLAVGKVFHSYKCSSLGITQVSNAHPEDISCIAADRFLVYTGCGKTVRAFQHNRQVKYTYEGHDNEIHLLLPFAEHLISVDKLSMVKVWHIRSQELFLNMEFCNETFRITAVVHPSTYLNKILFGSEQGIMQLWNIRKNQLLYEFRDSEDTSSILCLEQSPAVDVIAVGRSSGYIIIHNIKVDQTIMKFRQNEGPVIGIAFRTDVASTMVTGSPQGNIVVWDLEEKRLIGVMEHVHSTAIAGMTFLQGQPLLLTNASDNTIKMWAFDHSGGKGRLLRRRAGHSAPPTKIKFHADNSDNIISVGLDSTMRIFSTEHEENNKSFGQASLNRSVARKAAVRFDEGKLPPIVDFCCKTAREREWDNIIAFHHRTAIATTWNYRNSKMGSHKLLHDRFKVRQASRGQNENITTTPNATCFVTAVTMTECGNFCLVGYNTGDIDVYNIQSGIYRGSFMEDEKTGSKAHNKSISGLAVNFLSQVLISASLDKKLKFWRLKTRKLLATLDLKYQPSILTLLGENSLIAVAMDDFSLQVYDVDSRKLVRHFPGCQGAITDMTWSSDGRWLVSSSMDCTIKTWELPSSSLVDCFLVDNAAVSVALSPTSELLASCHVDDLGIYLWSNCAIFARISLKPLPLDFHPSNVIELPKTDVMDQNEEKDVEEVPQVEEGEERNELDELDSSSEPLEDDLITLSLLPSSRWAHLLSLDVIKQRNKPKAPPTLPKSAPFFLPTVAGLNPTFEVGDEKKESKIIERIHLKPLSKFASSLLEHNSEDLPLSIMARLKELGPSAIDIEIRGLSPDGGGSIELMSAFLSFILAMLKSKRDFELVESYLGLFLKIHTEVIASEPTLMPILKDIEKEHISIWDGLRKDIDQSVCLLNYIKSVGF